MKASIVGILFVVTCQAQQTLAEDVGYQLEATKLASIEKPQIPKPFTLKIKDRAWVVPGLEEARDEDLGRCSTGIGFYYYQRSLVFKAPDPLWTNEKLWPRTREMWGRGEYYRTGYPCTSMILCGLLQR